MYLFPYKIFTTSKDKRLLGIKDGRLGRVGIYDAEKYNLKDATEVAKEREGQVSVLLGKVVGDIRLICLDLDDCFVNGEMEQLTKEFIKEFDDNEWEVSISGTGIHIYILTKLDLSTFIMKDIEGSKSFECYTNTRHILFTKFDFKNTDLVVGKHDEFIKRLYKKVEEKRNANNQKTKDVTILFDGKIITDEEQTINSLIAKREPVTDMYTLRRLGYKDPMIIECIDMNPDSVDQSAHDAKLIRKLMYYTLSFDSAWEMAKKTNYYKHKDKKHQDKFNSDSYKERTRRFIMR